MGEVKALPCIRCGAERTVDQLDPFDYSVCRECIAERQRHGYGLTPRHRDLSDWGEVRG